MLGARLGQQRTRHQPRAGAERDVEQEDPRPAETVVDHCPQQRSESQGGGRDPRPNTQRPAALPRREGGGDDRQRCGRDERCADALQRASDDQDGGGPGQSGDQRCEHEHREADQEDAPPAVAVSQLATEKHEGGERQGVPVDHPAQPSQPEPELLADRGQRQRDRGVVEQQQERDERQARKHGPARPAITPCICRFVDGSQLLALDVLARTIQVSRSRRPSVGAGTTVPAGF